MDKKLAKPFIKWAGGKTQIIKTIDEFLPIQLKEGQIDTYVEPFVGGGALLFYILQNYKIKKAYINDINRELINCYLCIKEDVKSVIRFLQVIEKEYFASEDRTKYFLKIRHEYNQIRIEQKYDYKKCAEFIFLNKTCFNGLYRVNKSGNFNVPHGKYPNPLICDEENLLLCSELLQNVTIYFGDYKHALKNVNDKTLVYFDPPYRPLNKTNSFVDYTELGFNDEDQEILANNFKKISDKKAFAILSNSDPKNVNDEDNFFDDLYANYNIIRIEAKRSINSNGKNRGKVSELLITNYPVGK